MSKNWPPDFSEIFKIKEANKYAEFMIGEKETLDLKKRDTKPHDKDYEKKYASEYLNIELKKTSELQDKLNASKFCSLLIILQATDTAGKDGMIRHISVGFNPMGLKIYSYKTPSSLESSHDYLWRHYRDLPAKGETAIFNRSYYENVMITKVHPEIILNNPVPGINSMNNIDEDFWKTRYKQIRNFEKHLVQNGTMVLKFFLHISKDEQKERLTARINDPSKNWKFSASDLQERDFWDDYRKAYQEAIENTSTKYAPWFVLPSDNKSYAREIAVGVINAALESLNLDYPKLTGEEADALKQAFEKLEGEKKD